jgi:hypothetical protein
MKEAMVTLGEGCKGCFSLRFVFPHRFFLKWITIHCVEDDESKKGTFKSIVEDFAVKLELHLFKSNSTYLTESFSAADVCLSLWLALTMKKCDLSELPQHAFKWMTTVFTSLKPYSDAVASLLAAVKEEGGSGAPAVPALEATPTPALTVVASGEFSDNPIVKKLVEFGLDHEVYSHTACITAEELVANVPLKSEKETHTKNLLFKDKKHGMFLVTHATSSTFNTKQLGNLLNLQGKVNFRLADEATLDKQLQVKPGCVGPLCIINDTAKEIKLVLDKAMLENFDYIHSHPLRNDASVKLTPENLKEYLTKLGVEPVVLDFSVGGDVALAVGEAPVAPKQKPEKKVGEKKPENTNKKTAKKGETLLALQWKKDENFPMWYSDVIILSEMISYYDISGCYILRPWSYKVWDLIQQWFNIEVRFVRLTTGPETRPSCAHNFLLLKRYVHSDSETGCRKRVLSTVCVTRTIGKRKGSRRRIRARSGMGHEKWRWRTCQANCHSSYIGNHYVSCIFGLDQIASRPSTQIESME